MKELVNLWILVCLIFKIICISSIPVLFHRGDAVTMQLLIIFILYIIIDIVSNILKYINKGEK